MGIYMLFSPSGFRKAVACHTEVCANHNLSHIPHGFYEHQMRAYFSQFGSINRLRLSRNRNTGASKHYAFIEFASAEVANIVASTMNSYLLFGHILRCKVMPPEQVHEKLWVGANRRFKTVPWNRIEGRKLKLPMGREAWERRVETEKKRRAKKNRGLRNIGYEGPGGGLRRVGDLPVRQEEQGISNSEVPALELGNSAGETVLEENVVKDKPENKIVNEDPSNELLEVPEEISLPKVRQAKRKGNIASLEHEYQQRREDSTLIIKGSKSESQLSKRKADKEKESGAKKVRREMHHREALMPIVEGSKSELRTSKRKAENEKVSDAKKVRRKKARSDTKPEGDGATITEA